MLFLYILGSIWFYKYYNPILAQTLVYYNQCLSQMFVWKTKVCCCAFNMIMDLRLSNKRRNSRYDT